MTNYRTPDEQVYAARAAGARMFGLVRATRLACDDYLNTPSLSQYPPPIRWLWTLWTRVVGLRWASFIGAGACAVISALAWTPLALALSPLCLRLSQRHLQDTTVAALTLASVALGLHCHPYLAALVFSLTLCIKEGALPMALPIGAAMTLSGTPPLTCALVTSAAVLGWMGASMLVCGEKRFAAVFRQSLSGHRTDYTARHQSGMPHRLVADLVLCSPWVTLLAIANPSRELVIVGVMLAVHAVSPVRNVRTVLAADLLLRCSVGVWLAGLGWWGVGATVALVAYDVWVSRRLRGVFDTVTSALVSGVA